MNTHGQHRRAEGVAVVAMLSWALAACSTPPTLDPIEDSIMAQLEAADGSRATVDLAEANPADWDTVEILCAGASADELKDLGAPVLDYADPDSAGFLALFLFYAGGNVTKSLNVGQNVYFATNYTPCPIARTTNLFQFGRTYGELEFNFVAESNLWVASFD